MAHSKSALKRWRQNEARRARNKPGRTASRTAAKNARATVAAGEATAADVVREAASILDRAAKRRVIHPNAAARQKSRLARALNRSTAASAIEAAPPKKGRKAAAPKAKAPAKPRSTRAKKAAE